MPFNLVVSLPRGCPASPLLVSTLPLPGGFQDSDPTLSLRKSSSLCNLLLISLKENLRAAMSKISQMMEAMKMNARALPLPLKYFLTLCILAEAGGCSTCCQPAAACSLLPAWHFLGPSFSPLAHGHRSGRSSGHPLLSQGYIVSQPRSC
ncbi:hypothetical protein GDO81_023874 [Engystomops pustulosus]|uniref:Uncharacterized protein n=1 Tax=Engystomops pustulosus TaxID=76066 RepID=A0AAV6YS16_ENGPU|nr:hypothetical protein GDO81_023874 [Engystomops pustulosus]